MNILKKIGLFIKNIFIKKDDAKKLSEPEIILNEDKTENFFDSLKKATIKKKDTKNVNVLICEGDGLGIKKNVTY